MAIKRTSKLLLGSLMLALSLCIPFYALTQTQTAQGASSKTYYVNPSAKGAKTGLDWTNAFTGLPLSLERGATYYIADGKYASHKFNDAGTGWINITKAIPSDHGTNTGWSNSMGDGVAVFDPFSFTAGNYSFNGQVGGGPNSFTSGHGIKIASDSDKAKIINILNPVSNLVFDHVEMTLGFKSGYTGQDIIYGVKGGSDWTFKNSYLHHSSRTILYTMNVSNILIENCQLERNGQNQAQHSEIWSARGTDNVTIKNSILKDYVSTGGLIISGKNWNIYGNVFTWSKDFGTTANNGAIGSWSSSSTYNASNINIYNNSFINLTNGGSGRIFPIYNSISNVRAYNNLWHNSPTAKFGGGVTHDYNLFKGSGEDNIMEANKQVETKNIADPTTYKTAYPTSSGKALPAPYDTDMHGNKRGGDGIWDRGAFEINSKNKITAPDSQSVAASGNTAIQKTGTTTPANGNANPNPPNSGGSSGGSTSSSSSSGSSNPAPSGGGGGSYIPPIIYSGLQNSNPDLKKNLPYPSGSLLKSFDSPAVYLIENDQKRVIISGEAFLSYGYAWSDIRQVDRAVLTWYADGPTLYPDPAVKISIAPVSIPKAFQGAILVKTPDRSTVYAIISGKRHPILNEEVFNLYGFKWSNIRIISTAQLNKYQRVTLVKAVDSPTIYYLNENGQKKKILNAAMFQTNGYKWVDIAEILPQELNKYPETN